jgi:hypothetical protein
MKKLLMGLGLVVLLAGCASQKEDNGMGGTSDQFQSTTTDQSRTSDQSLKTDSINKTSSGQDKTDSSSQTNTNTSQP